MVVGRTTALSMLSVSIRSRRTRVFVSLATWVTASTVKVGGRYWYIERGVLKDMIHTKM